MADQRKALADTTELTDTVYFVHPTGIHPFKYWVSKHHHFDDIQDNWQQN